MHALFFWLLSNPLAVLLFLLGLALANLWRKRRDGRLRLLAVTVLYLLLVLFSTPACVYFLRGLLEWSYPPLEDRSEDIQAIVILGSDIQTNEDAPGGVTLDTHARSRCQRAAEMYRLGAPCPVLVSGGRARPGEPACASIMRDYLVAHGIDAADIIVEDESTDTYENALACRRILDDRQLHNILLVTDAIHLVRAVRCFRQQGIAAVGCGCHYLSTPTNRGRLMFWPDPRALQTCPAVCYEWLALPWYWIRGRI